VTCPNGHTFDVARHGYLSLLPGDAHQGTADTAAMVAAREAFLGAGHFDPLAAAVADEADRAADGPGCILDLGAGTGWYLAHVLERLPGRHGLALDLSKHALRRAARAHPRIGAVACDAWGPLPVRDGVAALVLSVFAPRNATEIARVLTAGGALIVVTPRSGHLAGLGVLSVDPRKEERLAAQLGPPRHRTDLDWPLQLTETDATNAVAMGPSARHETTKPPAPIETTASVTISVYRL
jgi:23S rRNA (guanine745-N1)-methyltransferase